MKKYDYLGNYEMHVKVCKLRWNHTYSFEAKRINVSTASLDNHTPCAEKFAVTKLTVSQMVVGVRWQADNSGRGACTTVLRLSVLIQ